MQIALLVILTLALAATVALLVSRSSLASSKLMLDYSIRVLELSTQQLANQKAEDQRQRVMSELAETVERLDKTVGNIFVQVQRQNRTILDKPVAMGETAPRKPGAPRFPVQQEPLPPEGMDPDEVTVPSGAPSVRARVLGEPT